MRSTRRRVEAALAVLFIVLVLAVGGRALWLMSRMPVHKMPRRCPSTAAAVPDKYAGASTTCALGWTVRSLQLAGEPARIVGHRGSPEGGTVSLLTFPDLGVAIAAAANVTDARGVDSLALQVAEAFPRQQNRQGA